MQVSDKLAEYLRELQLTSQYNLLVHLFENVTTFLENERVSKEAQRKVVIAMKPLINLHNELEEIAALPSEKVNLEVIKYKINGILMENFFDVEDIMQEELSKLNEKDKEIAHKLIRYLRKEIEKVTELGDLATKSLEKKKQECIKERKEQEEKLEVFKKDRAELEGIPVTKALVKKENPFRRLFRIMTEKPDTWQEVEVGNKIYSINSSGEIRGEVEEPLESDTSTIAKTEREIIKGKQHYSIFKRLKNLTQSKVFTIAPSIREKVLSLNKLNIDISTKSIEKMTTEIEEYTGKINGINSKYDEFAKKVAALLDEYKNSKRDILSVTGEILESIESFQAYITQNIGDAKVVQDQKSPLEHNLTSGRNAGRTVELDNGR